MPTPLLETTVRPDWREIGRRRTAQSARAWRLVLGLAVLLALATLALTLVPALSRRQDQWRLLLFALLFWPLPVWRVLRTRLAPRQAATTGVAIVALLVGAGAITAFAVPPSSALRGWQAVGPLPFWLAPVGAIVVLLVWFWLLRKHPVGARWLALGGSGWLRGLTLGATAGALLGLHYWFVVRSIPGWPQPEYAAPAAFLWAACALAAIRTPTEEFLLRGVGYAALEDAGEAAWPGVLARVTLINLFVHVTPMGAERANLGLWVLALAYAVLLAVLTTALRARTGRLAPSLACNFAFGLFAVAVFAP